MKGPDQGAPGVAGRRWRRRVVLGSVALLLGVALSGLLLQQLPWVIARALPHVLSVPASALSVGAVEVSLLERRLLIHDLVLRGAEGTLGAAGAPMLSLGLIEIAFDDLPTGDHVRLRSVRVAELYAHAADQRLLDIDSLEAVTVALDFARAAATIGALRLDGALGQVNLLAGGGTDLAAWFAGLPVISAPDDPDWRLEVADLRLANASVSLGDRQRQAPVNIDLRLRSLSGRVSAALSSIAPTLDLSGVDLHLAAVEVSVGDRNTPELALGDLRVERLTAKLPAGVAEADLISVAEVRARVLRNQDGSWPQLDALTPAASAEHSADAASAVDAPLRWRLAALKIGAIELDYRDEGPALSFGLRGAGIEVGPIDSARVGVPFSTDAPQATALAATLESSAGGRLRLAGALTGSLDQGFDSVLDWQLVDWSLAPFAGLTQSLTGLQAQGGALAGSGALALSSAADRPAFVATGSLNVSDMALRDEQGLPLVSWSLLALEGFDVEPASQRVRHVRVEGGSATVILNADRTTNFSGLGYSPGASTEAVHAAAEPSVSGSAGAAAGARPDAGRGQGSEASQFPGLRIDRISFRDAVVDLEDRGLVLPLNLRVQRLTGTVRGINSDPRTYATVRLGGEVGASGLASIEGQFAPFGTGGFSEFELSFRALDLLPLSPYFATFAGRRVDAGALDLDLQYQVRGGRITGDSRAVIDNLALGERVTSAGAMDLPLDLAVAILTDANGRIEVDMPLTGRVDAPGFAYGRMVRQALRRVIVDTASAPFRSIARALGLADAPQPVVRFPSGSAQLLPSERDRLAALAETLAARPGLGLRVTEGVLAERDARALRRLAVRREHARRLGIELTPEEDPGPISFEDPESQQTLSDMLVAREGEAGADRLAQRLQTELVREGASDMVGSAELYRAMYQYLVRQLPLPDGALLALGAARSDAIAEALAEGGIQAGRVRPVPVPALAPAKPAGVQVRIDPEALEQGKPQTGPGPDRP